MQEEKPLSEQESLALITKMINKAKYDYEETGISTLIWGSVITVCSIVGFIGHKNNMPALDNIWWLTILAVIVQVSVSIREGKRKKFTGYGDDVMGGVWISFGIAMFVISFYATKLQPAAANSIFLTMYGIPTFATGFGRKFTPMIIGGIACWVLAIAVVYTAFPYNLLYSAVGAQLAWFIPGLILRRRYLKAKRRNV